MLVLMRAKTSGFTDVERVSWLRVSAGWGEAPEFGVSRMELVQVWQQWRTFAAVHKQRRSFADTALGQAGKLVSSLVPFCSSPAADCWVCLCINEVVICLKEQLAGLPGDCSRLPGGCGAGASSRAGGGRSKRKTPTELLGISSLICWYIH